MDPAQKTWLSLRHCIHHSQQFFSYSSGRPFTTSINQSQRANCLNVQEAEEKLSKTFYSEMDSFLKKRIRSLTQNKSSCLILEENVGWSSTRNLEQTRKWSQNKPKGVQQMNFCGLAQMSLRKKKQKLIKQPYFMNTKEKLTRLVSKKNQKDEQYTFIKDKINQNKLNKIRKSRKLNMKNPPSLQTLDWDKEWQNGWKKQKLRFRTRLRKIHQRDYTTVQV